MISCLDRRRVALVTRDWDPEIPAKLLNLRSELPEPLRLQCPARGEPIALHTLSGVDDPPETRGLKFSTVMARFRTQSTSLPCPIGAGPWVVSGRPRT